MYIEAVLKNFAIPDVPVMKLFAKRLKTKRSGTAGTSKNPTKHCIMKPTLRTAAG
jgi:hypothetical protein